MDLGRLLIVFFVFFPNSYGSDVEQVSVWFDGNGKMPYAPDSYVVPASSLHAAVLGKNLFVDRSFSLKAGNISSWKWDYSSSEYILELKAGLKFSNGRPVTSKDLEFSLTRGLFSDRPSFFFLNFSDIVGVDVGRKYGSQFQTGAIAGIKTVDERRIAIKLKATNPAFLNSIAYSYFALVPIEELKSDYRTWKKWPIGAGSYEVLEASEAESKVILKRSVNAPSEIPSSLRVLTGGSQNGADVVVGSSLEVPSSLYTRVVNQSYNYLTVICFNYNTELGRSEDFRKAISLAIDRDEISSASDLLEPAYEFLPKRYWGRINVGPFYQDISAAKANLRKVSQSAKKTFSNLQLIPIRGTRGPTDFSKVLHNQLSKIGLNFKFFYDDKKLWDLKSENAPFMVISIAIDSYDPLSDLSVLRKESFLFPYVPFSDQIFAKIFDDAKVGTKTEKRVERVKAISSYIQKRSLIVPLVNRFSAIWYKKDKIKTIGEQDGGMTFFLDRIRAKSVRKD